MPDADGKPREPTQTLVKDVFSMMEVNGRMVWVCLARGSNRSYTGYFSSITESINVNITNFVACPGAQVYWWLRCRGYLAKDVNQMVCHCFKLDQQQKVTKNRSTLRTRGSQYSMTQNWMISSTQWQGQISIIPCWGYQIRSNRKLLQGKVMTPQQ